MLGLRKPLFIATFFTVAILSIGCDSLSPGNKSDTNLGEFSLNEKYARYYEETTLVLIPSQDYGEIYPYIGGLTSNPFAINPFIYGFCDSDGRIICDPSYVDMEMYEYEGKHAYVFSKSEGKVSEEARVYKMYIAAQNGSVLLEYDRIFDGLEGTFTVRNGTKWGSVDYNGNEVLPCVYNYPIFFGEGLAAVSDDISKGYKYVNKRNEIIIDQLPPIPEHEVSRRSIEGFEIDMDDTYKRVFEDLVFANDRAAYFDGSKYGYIDKSGEIIIDATFDTGLVWGYKFLKDSILVSIDESNRGDERKNFAIKNPSREGK